MFFDSFVKGAHIQLKEEARKCYDSPWVGYRHLEIIRNINNVYFSDSHDFNLRRLIRI